MKSLVKYSLAALAAVGVITSASAVTYPADPLVAVEYAGVTEPDLWNRRYDQYVISYVDGDGSVWYRVTSAQGMPGDPVVPGNTNAPGSAWTATGFVTPRNPRITKLLNHLDPAPPFVGDDYPDGWDADPREICVEYSNNNSAPWFGPICAAPPPIAFEHCGWTSSTCSIDTYCITNISSMVLKVVFVGGGGRNALNPGDQTTFNQIHSRATELTAHVCDRAFTAGRPCDPGVDGYIGTYTAAAPDPADFPDECSRYRP